MTADIHQIIAALKPDVFCSKAVRRQVKKILREARDHNDNEAFLIAVDAATLVEPNALDVKRLEGLNPFSLPGFKSPVQRHMLTYDSFEESLEALYFQFLDEFTAEDWIVNKLEDTFAASPGSGLASDMNRRQTQAQREARQLLRQSHFLIQDILRAAAMPNSKDHEINPRPILSSRSGAEVYLLRSKLETLKLYAHWLGPYLKQARQMEQNVPSGSDAVSVFNTALIEVTLLAQREYPVAEDVGQGELPKMFLKAKHRVCSPVLILELRMRAAPERASQGAYGYRGRLEMTITSYALNQDEIRVLRDQMERAHLRDLVGTMGGDAAATLSEILKQVEALVPPPAEKPKVSDDPNPFLALFGLEEATDKNTHQGNVPVSAPWDIKPDSDLEAVIRSQALLDARRRCLAFYSACKRILHLSCP